MSCNRRWFQRRMYSSSPAPRYLGAVFDVLCRALVKSWLVAPCPGDAGDGFCSEWCWFLQHGSLSCLFLSLPMHVARRRFGCLAQSFDWPHPDAPATTGGGTTALVGQIIPSTALGRICRACIALAHSPRCSAQNWGREGLRGPGYDQCSPLVAC